MVIFFSCYINVKFVSRIAWNIRDLVEGGVVGADVSFPQTFSWISGGRTNLEVFYSDTTLKFKHNDMFLVNKTLLVCE